MLKVISGLFRILSAAIYIVIVVALLIASPILLRYKPVVVLSGSMEPTFPVGSIVYYKAADFDEIDVGDAITFSIGNNSLATHRVVEKNDEERTFTTKGDNNPSQDSEPVSYDRVQGKVFPYALPYAGFLTTYIKNWYLIGGLGAILLIDMLLSPDDDGKNKKRKSKGSTNFFMDEDEDAYEDDMGRNRRNQVRAHPTREKRTPSILFDDDEDISGFENGSDLRSAKADAKKRKLRQEENRSKTISAREFFKDL